MAVIECWPALRRDVVNVALSTPPDTDKVPVPNTVFPSLKVTVPVGVPVPGLGTVTVAVNVTDWPTAAGDLDDIRVVFVPAACTFSETLPMLVLKWLSPE